VSWPLAKLDNHVDILSGFAFKSENFNDRGEGLPLVRIRDVVPGVSETYYSGEYSSEFLLSDGDLLIGMDGDFNRARWKGGQALLNQRVCKVTARADSLDQGYLYHFLQKALEKIHAETPAVTVKHLSAKVIRAIEIPLPPLPEQKRIAAILDKADAIRRKRQQAIQLADDFLRAVFLDMFGELVTSSGYANSQKYKLLELVDYIDYRGKTPEKSESGIPLITAKNVKSGYVDDEPREYIPEENYDAWMTRGFPRKNDVLFTTEAPLGNVALLGEYEKVAIGQRLVALRSKGKVTHEYLLFLLLHPFIQDLIYARSSGSTVKGIRTKELYAIELPVPDMQKQREFSAVYWRSKSLTSNQESAHQLDLLNFSALSQKAFAGQL